MPVLLWDASALAKRYIPELGTDVTDIAFSAVSTDHMAITILGYVEVFAIFVRKRNRGEISNQLFTEAVARLRAEVADEPGFGLLELGGLALLGSISHVLAHGLNASDAGILTSFLEYRASLSPAAPTVVVVSSDARLVRAAGAEGLATLNPETISPADVPAFLASLS